jgi:hypothetical protein
LTAINIQRGRDHGLPGFNMFRDNYDLPPYTEWSQINPDPVVWQSLARTYETIDDCDIYVCGLAEVPYNSMSNVGQTFHAIIKAQYHLIRDSDPFWYEADGYLTADEEAEVRKTTLAELISRNTGLASNEIQCLAMSLPDGCGASITVSPPQSYDFLVTLEPTTPSNPLFGLENDMTFSVNGINGATVYLTRGRNYTFFTQTSCNHAFYIATTPDITIPPFAPAYPLVQNQFACLQQNSILTLTVDDTTPSSLFYQCALHNFMGGNISIVDYLPTGSVVVPPTVAPTHPFTTQPIATKSLQTSATNTPVQVVSTATYARDPATVAVAVLVPILVLVIIGLAIGLWIVYRRKPALKKRESTVPLTDN